ncbi:hypothetical protein APHAL10511_002243 [Amanita phalloides]|nr:hypothetical protein APHAL10511_002243 [Amanita phalloides]
MKEFCPPLDSSLIAALLVDIEVDTSGHRTSPTQSQIDELRTTLRELAAHADESQLSELSDLQLASPTDASGSTPDCYRGHTDTSSSLASDSFALFPDVLTSHLAFLQAALPNLPEERLKDALVQVAHDTNEPDLWSIISNIFSDEAIKELEERGLGGLDDGDDVHNTMVADDISWDTLGSRKQNGYAVASPRTGKKTKHGHKFALVDIRQRHHARPTPNISTTPTEPWAVVMSISEQLANVIPSRRASYFQSFFHSPSYTTPYEAARAALTAIADASAKSEDNPVICTLLDILLPEHEDTTCRPNLYSDVQLAVSVTRGHPDDALDLVRILRDLDSDSTPGCMEMGIYHSPPKPGSLTYAPPSPAFQSPPHMAKSPSEPSVPPPPPPPDEGKPPPSEKQRKRKSSDLNWQTVPQRKGPPNSFPKTSDPGFRGRGNILGKGSKGDGGELAEYNSRIKDSLRKRDEYYREAHMMWKKGNAKTRGGEAAMFLVERAREYQALAKREALNAARAKVHAKRRASNEQNTIDLHGTTVAEAIMIVKEELEGTGYSHSWPLKIITGRGSHSLNQVSVLKPRIQKALDEDGWSVGVWEGGLIVRGKKATF